MISRYRCRERAELPHHFGIDEPIAVAPNAQLLERALGELTKQAARFTIQRLEGRRIGWWRGDFWSACRRVPESVDGREHHDERARCMFAMRRHHAALFEPMEQPLDCTSDDGNTGRAVVAASRNHEDLGLALPASELYLLLTKPCFGTGYRFGGRGQALAKVQRSRTAEPRLVECLTKAGE